MPFQEKSRAVRRRVVTPATELAADREQATNIRGAARQPRQGAADAVADNEDGCRGVPRPHPGQRRLEILLTPIAPAIGTAAEARRTRGADAAIIVGDDIEAVGGEKAGVMMIVTGEHAGGRIDNDGAGRRPAHPLPKMTA